uniref:Reverse transcriptase Ty1/copia-type domain-containing protein n=1 Tax=Ananas comosus var. bracteatus TaxID=296719 RepID=A0A6V7PFC9_ANACO|nr:unnamed protein product [Ananas comosus var. bracteatus]
MMTHFKTKIFKPNPRYANLAFLPIPLEPHTVQLALKHSRWTSTMCKELDTVATNKIWQLVLRCPSMNVIGCKWVFKTKLHAYGSLDRLKTHLVAKGFHQEEGVDFLETFNPVVKSSTIRTVLAIATIRH